MGKFLFSSWERRYIAIKKNIKSNFPSHRISILCRLLALFCSVLIWLFYCSRHSEEENSHLSCSTSRRARHMVWTVKLSASRRLEVKEKENLTDLRVEPSIIVMRLFRPTSPSLSPLFFIVSIVIFIYSQLACGPFGHGKLKFFPLLREAYITMHWECVYSENVE